MTRPLFVNLKFRGRDPKCCGYELLKWICSHKVKKVLSLSENNNRDVRGLLAEPDAVQDEQKDNTNR